MDEMKTGMSVDWKNIYFVLDLSYEFLMKGISVIDSFKLLIIESGSLFEEREDIIQKEDMLRWLEEARRDLFVCLARIEKFKSKECKSGLITEEWKRKRDDLSDCFALAAKKLSSISLLAAKKLK